MTNIKLLNKIASCGTDIFPKDAYSVSADVENADAIMVRSASMHDMELDASLQAVARAGAGVNNIPLDKCADAGVVVFNTPGANANGVKELAIAALLLASRDIVGGIKWANTLETDVAKSVEKGKSSFAGQEIKGKRLGVIGLGAIGGLVANAAEDMGMEVSLILLLIEYALSENKCNLSFIERTAVEWSGNGVTTIAEAEKYVAATYKKKTAWRVVEKAFGIEDRLASSKELENSDKWINAWGFKEDILRLAYEVCVDTKSKFSMQYVSKILDTWHTKGCKTAEDAKALNEKQNSKKPKNKSDYATYDIDLVEQMLNKGYGEN